MVRAQNSNTKTVIVGNEDWDDTSVDVSQDGIVSISQKDEFGSKMCVVLSPQQARALYVVLSPVDLNDTSVLRAIQPDNAERKINAR